MTAGSSFTNVFGGAAVKPSQVSYTDLTIDETTQLYWPTETMEGVPYVATQLDVTASVPGLSLKMPPADTGATGQATIVTNIGAEDFDLTDSTGTNIQTIAPGLSWLVTLTTNATAAGTWRAYQLASTTSSADASALAGPGLKAVSTRLEVDWVTNELSVDTAIDTTYRAHAIVWTGADGTLQFDTVANLVAGFICAVTNRGTGALTLSTSGGDTINGDASIVLQPGNSGFVIASVLGFDSYGVLIGTLALDMGGTGATNAGDARTNLGGTSIGQTIFTASNAAAVIAALGLGTTSFQETTVSTDQILNTSSTNYGFVCTAALNLTLPLTTTLTNTFLFAVYAQGGIVTITPQSADKVDNGSAGVAMTIAQGGSALFLTDANGNWWPLYVGYIKDGTYTGNLNVTGTLDVNGGISGASLTTTGTADIGTSLNVGTAINVGTSVVVGGSLVVGTSLIVGGNVTAAIIHSVGSILSGAKLRATTGAYNSGDGNAATILNDYTQSFGLNGYQIFPNGLIIQWGYEGSTNATFNFPMAFPTSCFVFIVGNSDVQGDYADVAYGYAVSLSQFFLATKASQTIHTVTDFPVSWIAVGF